MRDLQRSIRFYLFKSFIWLFYCVFQPSRFATGFEVYGIKGAALRKRALFMLRLFVPIFLCAYPLALALGISLHWLFPARISSCYDVVLLCVPGPNFVSLLVSTACTTVLGIAIGVLIGAAANISLGITLGFSLGIALGVARGVPGSIVLGVVLGLVTGIVLGVRGGLPVLFACCLALGLIFSFAGNLTIGIAATIIGGIALGTVRGIAGTARDASWFRSIAAIVTGCIAGNIAWLVAGSLIWLTSRDVSWFIAVDTAGIYGTLAFVVCYILGSYRLPLFPLSAVSSIVAYLASHQRPRCIFNYLHKSALYWDEHVFVTLPGLRRTLLLAASQDAYVDRVLQEIAFIVTKRPRQIAAARAALLEIVLSDLEQRGMLRDIAEVSERLTEMVPQGPAVIEPQQVALFGRLADVSRDIARYYSSLPLSWRARRSALEDTLARLERISPDLAFKDAAMQKRVSQIVSKWQRLARQEERRLARMLETTGQIMNPYNPGPILELRDSLFVGRRDLVRQLEDALGRGNRRPTFFLYGERRMGKSSTLRQLPDLLGPRYLPITYDLQKRGISSSSAAFLSTISEEIYAIMGAKGLPVKRLEYERLQDAAQENPASAYRLFDEWFREVERLLEQEDYVLLLAFDEFEKLEEAWQDRYLNLNLLLDWFRSVIQNRPRLALLFSGVRTFSEMGVRWAGYFVNVQTLKVSFLKPDEARQLITRPVPDFPGEEMFAEDVVEEILRMTSCHPFLIQAVCSKLIDCLNDDSRDKADLADVTKAVNIVLENWDVYFRDLWERTDEDQRACLFALQHMTRADVSTVVRHCGLDEKVVRHTLQMLHKRDLVALEFDTYHIATPIFCEWIKRNNY